MGPSTTSLIDVVAKLTDALARHEQTKPSNAVNTPRHSEDARSGSRPNVSIPLPRGATETYTAREGNVYERTPVKDEPAPAGMSPAQNHLGAGHPVPSGGDSLSNPIRLMIDEAERVQEGLGPDLDIFAHAGVKIPHPEPYSGEVDLERFKVFVAGILRWLSLNLLLGSSTNSTLVQLKYLGTHLAGDASEWYSHKVEHYTRSTRVWMLQSALIGLQKHFLHPLTHRHVSMQFKAVRQGSGTVQDLLNSLEKSAMRMVQYPDEYTMCKQFLAALRELLCH